VTPQPLASGSADCNYEVTPVELFLDPALTVRSHETAHLIGTIYTTLRWRAPAILIGGSGNIERHMAIYKTTFDINAPADRVWQVLASFDRYREWNPQIPTAAGTLEEGGRMKLRLALPGRPAMDLRATIEKAKENQLLSWRGHLLAPWFFEGYREFAIQPIGPGRVSVTHIEDVHGLFAPIFALIMGGPIQRSQQALNEALRVRAEHPL
jgi:hypothetical protein